MALAITAILAVVASTVVQAAQLPLLGRPTPYSTTGACESRDTCTYRFYSTQRNWDGAERQETSVRATVDISCSSVGTYAGQKATRYCMTVSKVTLEGDLFRDSSDDEILDDTEEDITGLPDPLDTVLHNPPITPEDKLMSNWFCFVQTEDGKVEIVQHPTSEVTVVVNFKKGIAAAFQSNFKGTTDEEEQDTMSEHRSTYSYANGPSGTSIAYRKVNTSDVIAYAGGTPRDDIELQKNEYIRYEGNTLIYSQGTTTVAFGAKDTLPASELPHRGPSGPSNQHILAAVPVSEEDEVTGPRRRRQVPGPQGPSGPRPTPTPSTYAESNELSEFSAEGTYQLYRVSCKALPSVGQRGLARSAREVMEDEKDAVFDTLGAKIDRKLIDQHQMQLLRQRMPSIMQVLETLHRDTENLKLADLLHRLVSLEAEHQPLPGYEPAVNDVIAYLNKLKGSEEDGDREMRMLLYSFLSPEGSFSAQKVLVDSFMAAVEKEERNALVSYIAFAANPHMGFVKQLETLISPEASSTDPLLLAYGSLASSSSAPVEEHILSYLLQRLDAVDGIIKPTLEEEDGKMARNSTWALIHLIHSLGNTGSKLSIPALLGYLRHHDLDVQLAGIDALRMHTSDRRVQDGFADMLTSAITEEQVEGITQAMIDGLEHTKTKNNWQKSTAKESEGTNETFLVLLVSSAMRSNDSRLHRLVLRYLQELGTSELAKVLEDHISKNPVPEEEVVHYGDESQGLENGTAIRQRARRGSDWDAKSSIYDLIASYSSRNQDVKTYKHKAYIWGKRFGLKKLYMQVAAGGFAGITPDLSGYKVFAKAVAQGHAFGKTATALRAEFLRTRKSSTFYQKIYAKVVGKVLINEAGYVSPICSSVTKKLYSTQIKLFKLKYSVFIYVGTVDFYVGLYAKLNVDLKLSFCEKSVTKACVALTPRAAIRAEGGASVTILLAIRGGIEVAAEFNYQVEPEVCIHFCKQFPGPKLKLKTRTCINVYDSWPYNYAEIYAYYQLRKFQFWPPKFYWGSKKKWNKLSAKWPLGSSSKKKIWGSCDPSIVCTGAGPARPN